MSRSSRIFIAELLGTMILILGGPGTVIFGQFLGFDIGVLGVSLAFGLSLLCAAYLFGHISGCHINPAVTVGMWALKRTPGRDVPIYILGQLIGAFFGSFIIWAVLASGDNAGKVKLVRQALFGGASNGYGSHSPGGFALAAVIITEVVFTALFILVIAGTTRASAIGGFAGIPIGLMLALDPHGHDPDRQHVGEPGSQLRHRAVHVEVRRLVGDEAAVGLHRVPDHRWSDRCPDLAFHHDARRRRRRRGGRHRHRLSNWGSR